MGLRPRVGYDRLHNVLNFCDFALQGLSEHLEKAESGSFTRASVTSNVYGGGEDVVGGLGRSRDHWVNPNALGTPGTGCQGCQNLAVRAACSRRYWNRSERQWGSGRRIYRLSYQIRCVADSLARFQRRAPEFLLAVGAVLRVAMRNEYGGILSGLTRNRVLDCGAESVHGRADH